MGQWLLLNEVFVGGALLYPGHLLDDSSRDVSVVSRAGGALVYFDPADADQQAYWQATEKMRVRGQSSAAGAPSVALVSSPARSPSPPTIYLDPSNATGAASDQNVGLQRSPLLTTKGIARLLGGGWSNLSRRVDVYLLSPFPAGAPTWAMRVEAVAEGFVYVHGGLVVEHAGTLSAATTLNRAGNAAMTVTAPANFPWAPYAGKSFLRVKSGASAGACAEIRKDLGGGVARLGELFVPDPLANQPAVVYSLAGNEQFEVVTPWRAPALQVSTEGPRHVLVADPPDVVLEQLAIAGGQGEVSTLGGTSIALATCTIADAQHKASLVAAQGCVMSPGSFQLVEGGSQLSLYGGSLHGAVLALNDGIVRASRDWGPEVGGKVLVSRNGYLEATELSAFDCDVPFVVEPGALMQVLEGSATHVFWGTGNTTCCVQVVAAGALVVADVATLVVAGVGVGYVDFMLDNLTSVGGHALTWANLRGVLAGNATDPRSGARVVASGALPPLLSVDLTDLTAFPLGEMSAATFSGKIGGTYSCAQAGTPRTILQLSSASQPLISAVGAGARIGDLGAGKNGLLKGGAHALKLLHSRGITAGGWADASGQTVTSAQAGPDGRSLAQRVQVTSGGNSGEQHFSFGNNQAIGHCWMTQPSGGTSGQSSFGAFNKAVGFSNGPAAWTWVQCQANPVGEGYWAPVDGADRTSIGGIAAGARDSVVDFHMIDFGRFAKFPADNASGTDYLDLLADLLSFPAAKIVNGAGQVSVELQFVPMFTAAQADGDFYLVYEGASDYIAWRSGTGLIQLVSSIFGAVTLGAVSWINQFDVIDLWVQGFGGAVTTGAFSVNGGTVQTLGIGPTITAAMPTTSPVKILDDGAASNFFGVLQKVVAYA